MQLGYTSASIILRYIASSRNHDVVKVTIRNSQWRVIPDRPLIRQWCPRVPSGPRGIPFRPRDVRVGMRLHPIDPDFADPVGDPRIGLEVDLDRVPLPVANSPALHYLPPDWLAEVAVITRRRIDVRDLVRVALPMPNDAPAQDEIVEIVRLRVRPCTAARDVSPHRRT